MKNIIKTDKKRTILEVTLYRDFNLWMKNILKSRLTPDIEELRINMSHSNRIDSEGVIFLHRWLDSGNKLKLMHPPAMLFDILDTLELTETWDLDAIIINE